MSVEMSEMRQTQLLIHLITELMHSKKMGQQAFLLRCCISELAVIACKVHACLPSASLLDLIFKILL